MHKSGTHYGIGPTDNVAESSSTGEQPVAKFCWTLSVALRLTLLVLLSVVVFQFYPTPSVENTASLKSAANVRASYLPLSVKSIESKDYPPQLTHEVKFDYEFLKPENTFLMEPYRENLVKIRRFGSASCAGIWTLRSTGAAGSRADLDGPDPSPMVGKGTFSADTAEFVVIPEVNPGKYLFSLQESCGESSSVEVVVWVKYVRRELATLTPADREEFLDAMWTLWSVNTKDGRQRFGDRYKSLYYLSMLHHDAANNGHCDEFHSGTGFMINHVLISSYFEQSLRTVNPRVALHYMEYGKYFDVEDFQKTHRAHSMDGGTWTELMTAKWFGANDPLSGKILDGRWAAAKIPRMDSAFFADHEIDPHQSFFPADDHYLKHAPNHALGNPYGLLRSRWNFSPHEGILRFNNIDRLDDMAAIIEESMDDLPLQAFRGVSCDDNVNYVKAQLSGRTISELMLDMETGVHGPAHFTIAGAGGDPLAANDAIWRERFGFNDQELAEITAMSQIYPHEMMQLSSSEGSSDAKTMICHDFPFVEDRLLSTALPGQPGGPWCEVRPDVLESEAAMDDLLDVYFVNEDTLQFKFKAFPIEDKKVAVQLLHQRYQYDGDLASSTGSVDPIFWVIHGALERLFQRVMFENVVTNMTYTSDEECVGHSANGKKYWLNGFYLQDESVDAHDLTNTDFVTILNPKTKEYGDLITYVYDNKNWDSWCPGFETEWEYVQSELHKE